MSPLHLYEQNGFIKETFSEGYFGEMEDRLILKKTSIILIMAEPGMGI
jgi:hypothetical protein